MQRLFLLRHGLAIPQDTEGVEDDDRPLTGRGERRVRQVARSLRRLRIRPDLIVASPLPRAARTAEIAADVLDLAGLVEPSEMLRPGQPASAVRDWLATRAESRILVVGHNPCLNELISILTTGQPDLLLVELHKAGVAALRSTPDGRYGIDWISRPRMSRS